MLLSTYLQLKKIEYWVYIVHISAKLTEGNNKYFTIKKTVCCSNPDSRSIFKNRRGHSQFWFSAVKARLGYGFFRSGFHRVMWSSLLITMHKSKYIEIKLIAQKASQSHKPARGLYCVCITTHLMHTGSSLSFALKASSSS